MSDRLRKCRGCGTVFTFSETDQAMFQARGFRPPRHCPQCRKAARRARQARDAQADAEARPR
jgi:hypothetical protein